jgi:hypothetical protein
MHMYFLKYSASVVKCHLLGELSSTREVSFAKALRSPSQPIRCLVSNASQYNLPAPTSVFA